MALVATSVQKPSFASTNEQQLEQKISNLETKVNEMTEGIRYPSIIQ